jgi:hypothetical protein
VNERVHVLGPLRPERVGSVRRKYDDVRTLSRTAESIVDEVVEEYSGQLDEFVSGVEAVLDDWRDNPRNEVADRELQRMVLRLPVIMYRLSSLIDRAAIESDVAKSATKIVYAQHYAETEGTIPDREAKATLATAEETVIVDLARHVHLKLKAKFEVANALFDGVRKVMTARDTEKQTFRKERG